ncbi:MAG: HD domain-containing phosphohydrolase [Solirubrobacteraceae bacterium]|jgi:putative two-component system response regulator
MHAELNRMQIIAVDDNTVNLTVLERTLRGADYENVALVTDPHMVEATLAKYPPDLVFLDLHMPERDGFDILRALGPQIADPDLLPICVITADSEIEVRRRALQMGARDFLVKPIDSVEVLLRTRNLLESRWLQRHLRYELDRSGFENLERLARIAESRDIHSFEHATRVGALARRIAEMLGLGSGFAALVGETATLHDVGKIIVPDEIIRKPGPLTPDEIAVVRTHTVVGAEMIGSASTSEPITMAAATARHHHEHWDGSGYPDGLVGEQIPLVARIVAVADVYDALTSTRPYRAALSDFEAIREIDAGSGTQFDPRVVDAFHRWREMAPLAEAIDRIEHEAAA